MALCPEGVENVVFANEDQQRFYTSRLGEYSGGDLESLRDRLANAEEQAVKDTVEVFSINRERYAPYIPEDFEPYEYLQDLESMKYLSMKIMRNLIALEKIDVNQGIPESRVTANLRKQLQTRVDELSGPGEEALNVKAELTQKVLNNFYFLWSQVKRDFQELGLVVENGHFFPESGATHDRQFWEDFGRFQQSSKKTASSNVKLAMSFIPRVKFDTDESGRILEDENGNPELIPEVNHLGLRSFYNMSEVWNVTAHILADEFPRTIDNFLSTLREEGKHNPMILQVWRKMSSEHDQIQRDFVTALGKHYAVFNLVHATRGRNGVELRPIRSDRLSREQAQMSDWQNGLYEELNEENSIVYEDEQGVQRVDQNQVRRIKSSLEDITSRDLSDEDYADYLRRALKKLGLQVPENYIRAGLAGDTNLEDTFRFEFGGLNNNGEFEKNSVIGRVFRALLEPRRDDEGNAIEGDPAINEVNPVESDIAGGALKNVARGVVNYRTNMWAPSFTNVENKRLHAIQDHEPLTVNVARLHNYKKVRRLVQDPFRTHSPLLRSLAGVSREDVVSDSTLPETKEDMDKITRDDINSLLENIDFGYIDGLSIQGQRTGQTIGNLSENDHNIQKIAFFQNNGRDQRFFQGPTLSDKERSYTLQLPKYQSHYGVRHWDADISFDRESRTAVLSLEGNQGVTVNKALYDASLSEIARIVHIQKWLKDNKPSDHDLGESYVQAAQLFHLFPELNEHNLSEELSKAIWTNGRLNDPRKNETARTAIIQVLSRKAEREITDLHAKWQSQDMIEFMNSQYLREQTPFSPRSPQSIMYAALDMYVNYKAFYADAFRLMHFDPAEASKWKEDMEPQDVVEATLGNFQKRLGGSESPSMTGNFEQGETFSKATLLDRFVSSRFKKEHREVFKNTIGVDNAEAYGDIESTDAQEYVTAEEYIKVSHAYGQISQELRDRLLRKIRNAKEEGRDYRFTQDELDEILFQPHKPVYFGQRWDPEMGQSFQVYTKSSAFPLIPQFTEGTQLDELRKGMERNGVDRVAYSSADKLGAVNPGSIFDSNGNIKPDEIDRVLNQSNQTLSRDGFGLQFLVPNKADEVTMSTQMNKLFFGDISNVSEVQEAKEKHKEIRKEMFEIRREELLDRLGAEESDDGTYDIDLAELKKVALDEAQRRDWNPIFIEEIKSLTEEDLESPLGFLGAGQQLENLLLSLVNDVVRFKVHGRAYVQQSSAGLKWENAKQSGQIAFTPDFDAETGLDFVHTEDGEVQAAEIVVGWHFKDDNGDPIPMRDFYTVQDGKRVLDMEKIEERLLKGVGFRIPYQGVNSTIPVKIVGFMPPETGVQAFVPDDIVTQMGSDFDVDKLNTYLRRYALHKNKLIGVDERADRIQQLEEEYIENLESVLYNPSDEVQARVRQPLDQTDLKDEIDRLEDQRGKLSDQSFTHFERQTADYISQKAGKDLIGITSLWSQLEATLQYHDVRHDPTSDSNQEILRANVREPGSGVREIELTHAGGPAEISSLTSGRISLQGAIRISQNASVDNAKESILGPLNINPLNAEVAMHMFIMNNGERGLDLEHMSRLMNQPIIREMLDRAAEIQSIFDSRTPFTAVEQAIEETILDRESQGIEVPSIEDVNPLPPSSPVENQPNRPNLLEDLVPKDTPGWRRRQLHYLRFFQHLNMQASNMRSIMDAFMFGGRRGPGSSLLDSRSHIESVFGLPEKNWNGIPEVGGSFETIEDNDSSVEFVPETDLGHSTKNSVFLADDLFFKSFGYDIDEFRNAIDLVEQLQDRELRPSEKQRIFKDYKSLAVTGAFNATETGLNESMSDMRHRLLYGNDEQADLASRINEARAEGWGRNRMILNFLETEVPQPIEEAVMEDGETRVILSPAQIDFRFMKMEDQDRLRLLQSVAQMLSSPRDAERELMRDIALYTIFSRGWRHTPSTMADLIPPQFLEEMGILSALRQANYQGPDKTWNEVFSKQYIQHNPQHAYNLSDDEIATLPGPRKRLRHSFTIQEAIREFTGQSPPGVSKKDYARSLLSGMMQEDPNTGETKAREFISYYDNSRNRRRLFWHVGEGQYEEIPVLGPATGRTNVHLEYDTSQAFANSDIYRQDDVKRYRKLPNNGPKNPRKTEGRQGDQHMKESGFRKYVRGETDLSPVLREINKDSSLPERIREVSKVLYSIASNRLSNTGVSITESSKTFGGGFHRGDNRIELNEAWGGENNDYHANVILHEAIHAATNSKIESYRGVREGDVSRSDSDLTDLEFAAFRDLESLLGTARSSLREEVQDSEFSWSQIQKWNDRIGDREDSFDRTQLANEQGSEALRLVDLSYGTENMREFVTHLMSESNFQSWAKEIEVENGVNFPQKFARVIKRIISAIAKGLGVDIDRTTLLGRGVEDVVLGIGFDQDVKRNAFKSKKKVGSRNITVDGTKYTIQVFKDGDGNTEKRVVNENGNALNQENQQRILEEYQERKNNQNRTGPSPPSPGDNLGGGAHPGIDPTDAPSIDDLSPAPSLTEVNLQNYTGVGRRDMQGTVGNFLQSLSPEQRSTFRSMRTQIQTRCD